MIYRFYAYGHPNILGTHKTTLEFTKDDKISLKGDCIIGINADFDLRNLIELVRNTAPASDITISIEANNERIKEVIFAKINPKFSSNKEFVVRKTGFVSERTFAINASKSAFELNRHLIDFLKEKGKILVIVESS